MVRIQYQFGSIFDSEAQVIVNTVNCKGVMGKGLALAFKTRYPDMFPVYQKECKEGKLRIGRPTLYKESSPWILNFPTKDNWKANSKLEYLQKGLEYFVTNYKKVGIESIAFPKLGAQNGKLSWNDVGPLMAHYLSKIDINVYIYISEGDREYQDTDTKETQKDYRTEILMRFNELALNPESLRQELKINQKDSKKIAIKRAIGVFSSVKDIEAIEGLAKISHQRISKFFHQQPYQKIELIEMTSAKIASDKASIPLAKNIKKGSKRIRKEEIQYSQQTLI